MKLSVTTIVTGLVLLSSSLASAPAVLADDFDYGPDTCREGYVWREAKPGDVVCVRPSSRTKAAQENALSLSRIDPAGAYGPFTCINGFVWREAFPGDVVCVTPARRTAVANENANAALHRTRG